MKLYGIAELAEHLNQRPGTVAAWHRRGKLPTPTYRLRMGPVWDAKTIERWKRGGGPELRKRGPKPKNG